MGKIALSIRAGRGKGRRRHAAHQNEERKRHCTKERKGRDAHRKGIGQDAGDRGEWGGVSAEWMGWRGGCWVQERGASDAVFNLRGGEVFHLVSSFLCLFLLFVLFVRNSTVS